MSSGIQGLSRWDVTDASGRPASILIGHTGEGEVAIGVAAGADDATFVFLDARMQVQVGEELRAAISRARQELL